MRWWSNGDKARTVDRLIEIGLSALAVIVPFFVKRLTHRYYESKRKLRRKDGRTDRKRRGDRSTAPASHRRPARAELIAEQKRLQSEQPQPDEVTEDALKSS